MACRRARRTRTRRAGPSTSTVPPNSEAEAAFLRWAERSPRRSLSIVRPSVVFGPGNRGNVYVLLQQIASGRAVMIGKDANRKSMAYVGNVADFLVHALGFEPGVPVCNYLETGCRHSGLLALVRQTLGTSGSVRIPYAVGLMAGIGFDLGAQLTGRQFSISAVRLEIGPKLAIGDGNLGSGKRYTPS